MQVVSPELVVEQIGFESCTTLSRSELIKAVFIVTLNLTETPHVLVKNINFLAPSAVKP